MNGTGTIVKRSDYEAVRDLLGYYPQRDADGELVPDDDPDEREAWPCSDAKWSRLALQ